MEESRSLGESKKGVIERKMGKITLPGFSVRVHKTYEAAQLVSALIRNVS